MRIQVRKQRGMFHFCKAKSRSSLVWVLFSFFWLVYFFSFILTRAVCFLIYCQTGHSTYHMTQLARCWRPLWFQQHTPLNCRGMFFAAISTRISKPEPQPTWTLQHAKWNSTFLVQCCCIHTHTGNLCRFGGHHGSKQKALISGSELFVPFWKHFNPVYWIERLQMISWLHISGQKQ